MADKYADNPADFTDDWGAYLRGEQFHINDHVRDDKRRAQQDYSFRPKPARQTFKIDYFGNGRSFPSDPIEFRFTFTTEPVFTFGVVAREGISKAYVGNATAFVLRYETNYQGFYTGAYMAYYVDVRDGLDQSVSTPVKVSFNLLFDGVTVPVSPNQ